jgi:hypothetical protein
MRTILLCFSFILASSYGFTLIKIPNCLVPKVTSFTTSSSFQRDITTSIGKKTHLTEHLASSSNRDDEDDWGSSSASSSTNSLDMKTELEALKLERDYRRGNMDGKLNSLQSSSYNTSTEKERDLFIPTFAIVSLAGLFGAYGYEMLRLNAQGELYLPWRQ